MARERHGETSGTGPAAEASGTAVLESAGVESLIGRLRDDGIAEGRARADALVSEAQQQAADIVAAAHLEAEAVLRQAKEEAGKLRAAGEDAIRLALRDTMLSLEGDLVDRFQTMLRRLVKGTLQEPEFLKRLVLEVAGSAAPSVAGRRAEVLLPATLVSLEDLRRSPEEAKPGTLMHFVLSLGGGLLREGVTLGAAEDLEAGIRVKLVEDDMDVELTETAVSDLLVRHLLPRFRALLRGAVQPDAGRAADDRGGERQVPAR
jgi:V/A-type H+-transporting ATPase subunit E